MSLFADAIAWLTSPEQWDGSSSSIPVLMGLHLLYTLLSMLAASAIAIPIGWAIGHTGRGREVAVAFAGAARALPSLGLLTFLVLLLGVLQKPLSAVIVLVVLAVPSILAGAYAGVQAVDRRTVDAARAMGMTGRQVLWRVEVPLGLPLLIGGLRGGMLQVVSTVAISAYIGLPNLGTYLIKGQRLGDYAQMLGGALLIVVLALLLDAALALTQRLAVPRGVVVARSGTNRNSRRAAGAVGSVG